MIPDTTKQQKHLDLMETRLEALHDKLARAADDKDKAEKNCLDAQHKVAESIRINKIDANHRSEEDQAWLVTNGDLRALDAEYDRLKDIKDKAVEHAADLALQICNFDAQVTKVRKQLEEAKKPLPKQEHHLSNFFDEVKSTKMTPLKASRKLVKFVTDENILTGISYEEGVRLLKQFIDSLRYYR